MCLTVNLTIECQLQSVGEIHGELMEDESDEMLHAQLKANNLLPLPGLPYATLNHQSSLPYLPQRRGYRILRSGGGCGHISECEWHEGTELKRRKGGGTRDWQTTWHWEGNGWCCISLTTEESLPDDALGLSEITATCDRQVRQGLQILFSDQFYVFIHSEFFGKLSHVEAVRTRHVIASRNHLVPLSPFSPCITKAKSVEGCI